MMFKDLKNLRELILNYNKISSINDNTFVELNFLNQLHLNGNLLTSLTSEVFIIYAEIKFLAITAYTMTFVSL